MDKKQFAQSVEELTLMLMYLTRFQDNNEFCRYLEASWKGYDFGALNKLEEQEMIIQQRKSKCAYLTETGKERARRLLQEYQLSDQELYERFEFRDIRADEAGQAAQAERICFPPSEACTEEIMRKRVAKASGLFLVAICRQTGKIAGFLNGISTDEYVFRDAFFTDVDLHNPDGRNIMLLGLDVLPEYRRQGLAREMMYCYLRKQRENGKQCVLLTCLPEKVKMYKKMGFQDKGVADSSWGDKQWHEMAYVIN